MAEYHVEVGQVSKLGYECMIRVDFAVAGYQLTLTRLKASRT